jgi:hypothetical protein
MLSREDFVTAVLAPDSGADEQRAVVAALPEGREGFDVPGFDPAAPAAAARTTVSTRRLLEKAGFGQPELVQKSRLIPGNDSAARHLPERVAYWGTTQTRPFQTLLFEAELTHRQLLSIPTFCDTPVDHLDDVEAALTRFVAAALAGFQAGGDTVTADVRQGRADETLCIISIVDERDGTPSRLVCFGTRNKVTGSLETFQLTEQTRFRDPRLVETHLGLLYERQFRNLATKDWQEAFTTTKEREQAERLVRVCTKKSSAPEDIVDATRELLDTIAGSFGLRRKPRAKWVLEGFELPGDHDIGADSSARDASNPFGGMSLRDERKRLLGYLIYPLDTKASATRLRKHLEANNRFHNVLVVHPDGEQAVLELWQGRKRLAGKLRKGQGHKDAAAVVNLLQRFFVVSKAKVRNPAELAQELACRARYLRLLARKQLQDEAEEGPLRNLYDAFKKSLVHDRSESDFADAFAQTLTYGLLTARWLGNDELVSSGARFTRRNAPTYLPPTSPFLTDLFRFVSSAELEEQRGTLLWLVDDLADLLDRIDIVHVFGAGDAGSDAATDPVIHFYEPFLAAYDRDRKNQRGVFFTPRPVVSYIVRSIHETLRAELGLEDGLGSIATWNDVAQRLGKTSLPHGISGHEPFLSILDFAAGTGTFLYECIGVIERELKERWRRELGASSPSDERVLARWREYVPRHLLPRLFGYELMMASYAVAHLKLSFKLAETGYSLSGSDCLHVHLTNSLEPPSTSASPQLAGLFATLAREAQEVDRIKAQTRFTVVMGNPPYSASMSEPQWLLDALEAWKEGLDEAKSDLRREEWKFLRMAQLACEMSPFSILGVIINRDFLDGIAKRKLRESLQETFPSRRLVDLNGDVKGNVADENVFDITQGVAIALLCRGGKPRHSVHSLQGSRQEKYRLLAEKAELDARLTPFEPVAPYYRWIPLAGGAEAADRASEYAAWFSIDDMFGVRSSGIQTKNDPVCIGWTASEIMDRVIFLSEASPSAIGKELGISGDGAWSIAAAKEDLRSFGVSKRHVRRILYRPFDWRFTYFTNRSGGFLGRPRFEVMRHMVDGSNIGLIFNRQVVGDSVSQFGVSRDLICHGTFYLGNKGQDYLAPLYLLADGALRPSEGDRRHNFTPAFLSLLRNQLGPEASTLSPEEMFFYVYGVVHSPTYRARYVDHLKLDFPRVPITSSLALFRALSRLGRDLAAQHLFEASLDRDESIATYSGPGQPEVEKVSWRDDAVWIDKKQKLGFQGVPFDTWNFCVGGYQVCEKWLKDRKRRTLSKAEIAHYLHIVRVLRATSELMGEVDLAITKHGGWPGAFRPSGAST